MPQKERYAEGAYDEQKHFDFMLKAANLLYLGGTVLVLLDEEYAKRFWCSVEFWLSTQECTAGGLRPAEDPGQRCKVVLLPGTAKELEAAQHARWTNKSLPEACELMRLEEVKVTNKGSDAENCAKGNSEGCDQSCP